MPPPTGPHWAIGGVHGGRDALRGPDEVGEVLLGEAVLDEHFVADLPPALARSVAWRLRKRLQ